ncbi:hypothetical protein AGOR_G00185280 [Albula goreensis]|uniref:USP domain-containing protein n=1 Tax=Albula goreensis TaxID=1534307 RepID=A0A8T3CXR2_9TELE|nr:hypothetical protein AGOR_G00185280 [Albula goreensis]
MGLQNYSLSCCVNALLQSFSATKELLALLNRVDETAAVEEEKNVPLQLRSTLQAMQSEKCQPAPHRKFLECLNSNRIRLGVQHDADEVFLSILNLIQEQITDVNVAQDIKCLYMVTVEEYLQCNECTYIHSGVTYLLSLPLPLTRKENKLEECFKAFFELQELENEDKCFCDRCGEKTPSKQGLKLISLPPVMCIHLKRFRSSHGFTEKLYRKVSFPETLDFKTILNPDQISTKCQKPEKESQYKLYAVVVHSGTAMFGHYTAYVRLDGDIWYHADDSHVSKVTWETVEGTFGGCMGKSFKK